MANAVTLEFRATVSFILEGVPHHAAGAWHTSKKTSQRDAAERVLVMLKIQANDYTSCGIGDGSSCCPEASAVERLSDFVVKGLPGKQNVESLQWRCVQTETGWQATVEVCIFGDVLHTLQGVICSDEQTACEDTANRALWYFKAQSHLNAFEVCHEAVVEETLELPPDDMWLREGMATGPALYQCEVQQRAAEQKTTLMRVQNQLQKRYGKDLPSGTPVWEWSYEYTPMNAQNTAAVPTCCARVWIAGMNREFQGSWCRGLKQAQLNACARVTEQLDAEAVSRKSDSRL